QPPLLLAGLCDPYGLAGVPVSVFVPRRCFPPASTILCTIPIVFPSFFRPPLFRLFLYTNPKKDRLLQAVPIFHNTPATTFLCNEPFRSILGVCSKRF